jgi:hypothetical protein
VVAVCASGPLFSSTEPSYNRETEEANRQARHSAFDRGIEGTTLVAELITTPPLHGSLILSR